MPLGNAYINLEGEIAMPLDRSRSTYLMPDNSLLIGQQGGAFSTNGTAYVGGNGVYSGTDGSTAFVTRHGDVYEFEPRRRDRNPMRDPGALSDEP